jgi:hypothetical protein
MRNLSNRLTHETPITRDRGYSYITIAPDATTASARAFAATHVGANGRTPGTTNALPRASAALRGGDEQMTTVSFDISSNDRELVRKIVARATVADDLGLTMDLVATHANGNPMDFTKLLAADEFNFWHDVGGISQHLDRDTGELRDFFSPRCSRIGEFDEA